MEGYMSYTEMRRRYGECVFKILDDGSIDCKLLPTSPDEPDDRVYMAQYYDDRMDNREETIRRNEEQQQTNDGVEAAQYYFVVDGDWYSDEEAEEESGGESLILEEEYESEGESLNLDEELLECELDNEVFYSGDGREDNPIVID